MSAASAPPFAESGGIDIGCIMEHPSDWQHVLCIQSDEENDDRELNVSITIIAHGQPQGNITVPRAAVIEALGFTPITPAAPADGQPSREEN